MSIALGMHEPTKNQVYQGWWGDFQRGFPPPLSETEYQKWTRLEWEELGDEKSLYWALMNVIDQQTDLSPGAPVNNYRLRGHGFIWELFLRD